MCTGTTSCGDMVFVRVRRVAATQPYQKSNLLPKSAYSVCLQAAYELQSFKVGRTPPPRQKKKSRTLQRPNIVDAHLSCHVMVLPTRATDGVSSQTYAIDSTPTLLPSQGYL